MRVLARIVTLVLLGAFSIGAQSQRRYYKLRTVTGTVNRLTFRQPASGARAQLLDGVFFRCSVACTPEISRGGTVSGGTGGSITALDDRAPAATAALTQDGTVSGATVVFDIPMAAGTERSHSGGMFNAATAGVQNQITVGLTSGVAGELSIYVQYTEQ